MAAELVADIDARSDLTRHMDGFLDALVSRDPGKVHLAQTARYTENGQFLPIGEGAWATVDRLGGYRHDFVDIVTGNIGTFATIVEGKSESVLVVRLKVERDGITQIEAMIARSDFTNGGGLMAEGPAKLNEAGAAEGHWSAIIPEAERMSRDELRRITNLYFAGIEKNDGRGNYPFSDDCIRIENGFRTTGMKDAAPGKPAAPSPEEKRAEGSPYTLNFMAMNAKEQLETGFFAFVDRIRHRRFPVIDEERGLVFSFAFFDHSGTVRSYALADRRTIPASLDRPFTWEIGEAFKIEKGLITRIEAVMTPCPYGMPPNWPMLEGDIH